MLLLIIGAYSIIKVPAIQSWCVNRITNVLSDKLGADVRIGSVDINFFTKLVLNDVYVEDEHGDTLVTIQQLTADFNAFTIRDKFFNASSIDLYNANLHMKKYKGEKYSNLKFITDYFKSSNPDSLKQKWDFLIKNIAFHHCTYSMINFNDSVGSKSKINFKNLLVQEINGEVNSIYYSGDTIFAGLKDLSFYDHSGFAVNGLSTITVIGPDRMEFRSLSIVTDKTNLRGYLKFSYDSLPDFKKFAENVRIDSEFDKCKIASSDIAFFAQGLEGLDKSIILSGKIRGRILSLKGRDLDIRYSRSTRFIGNISLHGLPDISETYIDLVVNNFYTTRKDLVTIPRTPFKSKDYLAIPNNVSALGNIKFRGKFTGFLTDFVALGSLESDLGILNSDLNFKLDKNNKPKYSGKLIADNFDFGTYYGLDKKLGKSSFEASVLGSGVKLDDLDAEFDGIIRSIELNNYIYENINADGKLAKGLFKGALNIDEKNLAVDFDGTIDFTGEIPIYDFKAKINKAKLNELKIVNRENSSSLIANADIKFSGDKIDNIQGLIQLQDVVYVEGKDSINIKYVTIVAVDDSINKTIDLTSDLVDASIDGIFDLKTIGNSIKRLVGNYFPLQIKDSAVVQSIQAIRFEIDLKKTDDLFRIFKPGLLVSEDTQLEGYLNTTTDEINFHLTSEKIVNKRFRFNDIDVQGSTKNGQLNLYSEIGEMYGRDSLLFSAGKVYAGSTRDSATVNLKLGESNPTESFLDLYGSLNYIPSGGTILTLLPSNIVKFNEKWNVNTSNEIVFIEGKAHFNNVIFSNSSHSLQLDGILSENEKDLLNINLNDFDLRILNNAVKMYRIQVGGTVNGTVHLSSLTTKPLVTTDLVVKHLQIFKDTIGDATILSRYLNDEKIIKIDADISRGGAKNITVDGKYFIRKPYDLIDATIEVERLHLSTLERYIQTVASDVKGIISGKAHLTGKMQRPEINGIAKIQKASFLVDYLNTRYNFTSDLTLINDHILLKDMVLNDEDGSKANVNGRVFHNNLGGLSFDVKIAAENFKCLNTKLSQNDLYYGKAYGTGIVDITGNVKRMKMDIAMKSERGTAINIPLSNPEEVASSNFITFINIGEVMNTIDSKPVDLKGIEMNFELEVTRDADIQLIFDEKIGDVIRGTGTGNLIMEIDRVGNFNMFGNYEVYDGKYDFTLQNVIDKKFRMVQGGNIRWNGDPYEAIVDLEAVYFTKANINDLIPSDVAIDSSASSNRVPVTLHLYITERLLNPEIKMEINLPDIDPSMEGIVYRYLDSEQEINEQAFSLLILNRFSTPDEFANSVNTSSGSAVSANLSEFASNQLSAWASQISKDLDIGVKYQAADAISEEEIELALRTKILNDRVILDGNVGVIGKQSANDIVGDFIIEVLLGKEGRYRIKAFNKSNSNTLLDNFESDYTQGIGLFYRKEFNTLSEAFTSYRRAKRIEDAKKKEQEQNQNSSLN